MASTVNSSKDAPKTKTSKPAPDLSRVEEIRDLTFEVLQQFPILRAAPDIMYYLMATWGAESGWKLYHGQAKTSRHLTVSRPNQVSGVGINKGTISGQYQGSNIIQNLWNAPDVSAQTRFNIQDGWYAHGITACMGSYLVKGCPANLQEWRSRPEAIPVITSLGLEVAPGASISQTLFGSDTKEARRRSIATGIIIFNSKYRAGLVKYNNNTALAMQYALGAYLGKQGARDSNNVSPDDRRADLNSYGGRAVILKQLGIVRSGDSTVLTQAQKDQIDIYNKSAKDSGSTTVVNNTAGGPGTNSGANGNSGKIPGCEA